jgi:hypothetical protein
MGIVGGCKYKTGGRLKEIRTTLTKLANSGTLIFEIPF